MDFLGGLSTTTKGCDYLLVVVEEFNKMCVLMPCKNTIIGKEVVNLFFGQVWVCCHLSYHVMFVSNGPIYHPWCKEWHVHSWMTKAKAKKDS